MTHEEKGGWGRWSHSLPLPPLRDLWSKLKGGTTGKIYAASFLVLLVLFLWYGSESSPPVEEIGQAVSPPATVSSPQPPSSQAEDLPIIRSALIHPNPLILKGPVTVAVEADNPDGRPVSLRPQWFVNGEKVEGQTGVSMAPELLTRGDRVSVEVIPVGPKGEGIPYRTDELLVANTPPEGTNLGVEPFPPRVGDRILARPEGRDVDEDDIHYAFRWFRNKELVAEGEGGELDTTGFHRGDEIILIVTPHDETEAGQSLLSKPIVLANTPPEITSTPTIAIKDGLYRYSVRAVDRDGDALTYALQNPPPGMAIDPKTGKLEWTLTPDIKGTHHVRVTVTDGQGEEPAFQEFDLVLDPKGPESTPSTSLRIW